MSYDDIFETDTVQELGDCICGEWLTCDAEHCMHKLPHGSKELGRPEQGDCEYSENWDCSKRPCSKGGLCV